MKPGLTALICCLVLIPVTFFSWAEEAEVPVQMGLEQAIAYALTHNPRMQAALAQVEGAQASLGVAKAIEAPYMTLSASARLQNPIQEMRPAGSPTATQITREDPASATFQIVWPLWGGGRIEAAKGLARADLAAKEANLQQTVEQLIFEVGLAFYSVLDAGQQQLAAEAKVNEAQEKLRYAEAALKSGYVNTSEVALVKAVLAQAKEALGTAENALDYSTKAFNTALGRPFVLPIEPLPAVLDLGDLPEQEAAYELALERRPELLALSHRADSARYAVERAKAEADPQLGLLGQYTVQTPTDTLPSHHELVGLEFSWPFSDPTQSGQVGSAEAGTREVAALRDQLQQAIRLQVAEASFKVTEGKTRYGTAQQSLEARRLAANKAEAAYKAGALLKRELLEATTARIQAEAGLARAGFALDAASLNYARALGLLRELLDTRQPEVEIQ